MMGGTTARGVEKKNTHTIMVEKPGDKRSLGRHRRRRKNNIKT
jgi:hypothetical protein